MKVYRVYCGEGQERMIATFGSWIVLWAIRMLDLSCVTAISKLVRLVIILVECVVCVSIYPSYLTFMDENDRDLQ